MIVLILYFWSWSCFQHGCARCIANRWMNNVSEVLYQTLGLKSQSIYIFGVLNDDDDIMTTLLLVITFSDVFAPRYFLITKMHAATDDFFSVPVYMAITSAVLLMLNWSCSWQWSYYSYTLGLAISLGLTILVLFPSLPPRRDPALLSRLRAPSKSPRIPNRTKKYQSFISHALSKYIRPAKF